ncbi:MAG: penicillin-binding protein 2, partial [Actinomycetota bacterium]|nr:penicillin-binding protein 2 [Actinomycetota bacterium]
GTPRRRPSVPPRRIRLGDPRRRLHAALLVTAMVLSLFATRLFQLQGLEASAYAESAANDRLTSVKMPARRGTIFDTHGVALATSVEARDLVVDPSLVAEPLRRPAAEMLANLLDRDVDEVMARLSAKGRFSYVAKGLPPELARAAVRAEIPGTDGERVPTLQMRRAYERVYPAGKLASNVVGFVGVEGKGLAGLEYALQDQLAGRDGERTYERGAGGRTIPLGRSTGQDAVPGRDVRLSLDRDIQWTAQEAVTAAVRQTKAESGTVVVLDVKTGHIYALATAPAFDPNGPVGRDAELGNRALSEAYEPGSTGKIITAAALVEEGAVRPGTRFTVPNRLRRADKSFKDWADHPTQKLTFAGTLAKSSNIGTILAAERLGFEQLHPYMKAFGIGEPTGLGFPGETTGALPDPRTWSSTTGYTLAFGQGYAVNTVQMASVFATVANGGVRVAPTLVEGWTDAEGVYRPAAPGKRTRVVSEATARTVARMMEGVVGEGGTAPSANIPGYRVAGKTGTAQRYDASCGCYRGFTMSFLGFAPADAPRLVVGVTLQKPRNGIGGGASAGPVFHEVMSFALSSLRIPPTGAEPPKVRLEWGR